jgi:hypothetical protein
MSFPQQSRSDIAAAEANQRRLDTALNSDRPQVIKYGPESQTPVGQGRSWPWWAWLVALVLLIVFVASAQGWFPWT